MLPFPLSPALQPPYLASRKSKWVSSSQEEGSREAGSWYTASVVLATVSVRCGEGPVRGPQRQPSRWQAHDSLEAGWLVLAGSPRL